LSKEEFNKIDKMHSAHEKKHWPAYASNVASLTAGGAAGSAGGYLLGKKLFNNVKGVKGEVLRTAVRGGSSVLGAITGTAGGASVSDTANTLFRKGFAKDRDKVFAKTPDSYFKKIYDDGMEKNKK
jgi:hypothetical protein